VLQRSKHKAPAPGFALPSRRYWRAEWRVSADIRGILAMSAARQTRGRVNLQPPSLIFMQRSPARRMHASAADRVCLRFSVLSLIE